MTTQEKVKARFGEQLDALKQQHGGLKAYCADDKIALFKNADIETIDMCQSVSKGKELQFDIMLLKNCFVAGDDDIVETEKYLLGATKWSANLIEVVAGEMVEL
jgi:hypothetical protein